MERGAGSGDESLGATRGDEPAALSPAAVSQEGGRNP